MRNKVRKNFGEQFERMLEMRTRSADTGDRPPGNTGLVYHTHPKFLTKRRGESPHNSSYGAGGFGGGTAGP